MLRFTIHIEIYVKQAGYGPGVIFRVIPRTILTARDGGTAIEAMRLILILLVASGLSACLTFERPRPCRAEAQAHLRALDVPQSDIADTTLRGKSVSAESNRFSGHALWVKLNSCRGRVVLEMGQSCQLRRTFATGDCKVPARRGHQARNGVTSG